MSSSIIFGRARHNLGLGGLIKMIKLPEEFQDTPIFLNLTQLWLCVCSRGISHASRVQFGCNGILQLSSLQAVILS